jgi:hypothetical protein
MNKGLIGTYHRNRRKKERKIQKKKKKKRRKKKRKKRKQVVSFSFSICTITILFKKEMVSTACTLVVFFHCILFILLL